MIKLERHSRTKTGYQNSEEAKNRWMPEKSPGRIEKWAAGADCGEGVADCRQCSPSIVKAAATNNS